jgi:hypothetical protein
MSRSKYEEGGQVGGRKRTLPNLISPEMFGRIHDKEVRGDLKSVISEF